MTAAARTRSQRRKRAALPPAPTPTLALVRAGTADVAALRADALRDEQARSSLRCARRSKRCASGHCPAFASVAVMRRRCRTASTRQPSGERWSPCSSN